MRTYPHVRIDTTPVNNCWVVLGEGRKVIKDQITPERICTRLIAFGCGVENWRAEEVDL